MCLTQARARSRTHIPNRCPHHEFVTENRESTVALQTWLSQKHGFSSGGDGAGSWLTGTTSALQKTIQRAYSESCQARLGFDSVAGARTAIAELLVVPTTSAGAIDAKVCEFAQNPLHAFLHSFDIYIFLILLALPLDYPQRAGQ